MVFVLIRHVHVARFGFVAHGSRFVLMLDDFGDDLRVKHFVDEIMRFGMFLVPFLAVMLGFRNNLSRCMDIGNNGTLLGQRSKSSKY